jgi:hypothetical protein
MARKRAHRGRFEEGRVVLCAVEDKEARGWKNAGGHGARHGRLWRRPSVAAARLETGHTVSGARRESGAAANLGRGTPEAKNRGGGLELD